MGLPPGQRERGDFPRFGMPAFAGYRGPAPRDIQAGGLVGPLSISAQLLEQMERRTVVADLNCVTTWSVTQIAWEGVRFRDLFEEVLAPHLPQGREVHWVSFRGDDGFRSSLRIDDALSPEVLLADRMNGKPIPLDHGAYWRVVAPSHYAYKHVKHLAEVDLWERFKPGTGLLEHPRGRVAFEERGRWFPGKLLRYVYRPLIGSTVRKLRIPSQDA